MKRQKEQQENHHERKEAIIPKARQAVFCGLASPSEVRSNNRLQGTGTLKVGQASKVLFRLAVLRKRSPVPEPGVRWATIETSKVC